MKQHIWIVDPDEKVYSSVYKQLLKGNGFVIEQHNCAEKLFLRLQETRAPDVIILEKWQPDMDGLRVCQLFRQLRNCHDIPVILVSEASGLSDSEQARQLGAFDYIPKPFKADYFQKCIQKAVALRQKYLQLNRLFFQGQPGSKEYDQITGLPSQVLFEQALKRAHQGKDKLLSLSLIDLDFFAFYNESYGQTQGDYCLRRVAEQIKKVSNARAQCFRLAADGFAILESLPRKESLRQAELLCHRVRLLEIPHAPVTGEAFLSVSIGTATLNDCHHTSVQLLHKGAQQALFQAKTWGRDQARQFFEI